MGGNRLKIIFGILATVIAVGGFFAVKWVKGNNQIQEGSIGEEYTPQEEIAENQERQTIVTLYFPNKETNIIMPEARLVDIKEMITLPYEKLLNLLIDGPKNEKLERIIPKGTSLLRAFMDKDCLVLDFSKDFLNYDMEKDNCKENLINSIVKTMTELNEVNKVKFLIEGQENELFNEIYER